MSTFFDAVGTSSRDCTGVLAIATRDFLPTGILQPILIPKGFAILGSEEEFSKLLCCRPVVQLICGGALATNAIQKETRSGHNFRGLSKFTTEDFNRGGDEGAWRRMAGIEKRKVNRWESLS